MNLYRIIRRLTALLPPSTWLQVYSAIFSMLLGFIALSFLIDALKGALP